VTKQFDSGLIDDHGFESWPGDPFAGMTRKFGQIDYECNACGRSARHPYSPDVPLGWWFLFDRSADIVHLACKPECAAKYSKLQNKDDRDIKALVRTVSQSGWRYRSPEKKQSGEVSAPAGVTGGWGNGSV